MNQMIDESRGLLVAAHEGPPCHLSRTWHVDEAALEQAVERALAMDEAEWRRLGANARAWHLATEVAFPLRLSEALAKV